MLYFSYRTCDRNLTHALRQMTDTLMLTSLQNITGKSQTHYINRQHSLLQWFVDCQCRFDAVCEFRGYRYLADVVTEWISWTSCISIFRQWISCFVGGFRYFGSWISQILWISWISSISIFRLTDYCAWTREDVTLPPWSYKSDPVRAVFVGSI